MMTVRKTHPPWWSFICVAAICATLLFTYMYKPLHGIKLFPIMATTLDASPQRKFNVAIGSGFKVHLDVYFPLVASLEKQMEEGTVTVYKGKNKEFLYGFENVVDQLGLYSGEIRSWEELFEDLASEEEGEWPIDLLILGTCSVDLTDEVNAKLLDIWEARNQKFTLACFAHRAGLRDWQKRIADWSSRDSLRLLTISDHVSKRLKQNFDEMADSNDPKHRKSGWEYIPVDRYVPILHLDNGPPADPGRLLSNAVIQGHLSMANRNYVTIFRDLLASLKNDPRAWGYLPLDSSQTYTEDPTLATPSFKLYLAGDGSSNDIIIPPELSNIVIIKSGLSYNEFYSLVRSMDICIPALPGDVFLEADVNESRHDEVVRSTYFEWAASSTVAMAIQCDLPLLVTNRFRNLYTHLDDDRLVVTRPAALSEIEAIYALRTRQIGNTWGNDHLRQGIEDMLEEGWTRDSDGMMEAKEEIWAANEQVVGRMLRDLS